MNLHKTIQDIAILTPPFLLALTIHEYAHGMVANRLGDPTAKLQGRLTMNPFRHLDPLGVLAFFLIQIGWAKPVPVDARYFKKPRRDIILVSLAGVTANLGLAIASGLAIRLLTPLAPILGMAIFWPLAKMVAASVWINLMLALFNLIPIPPLDGSRVVANLLPYAMARRYERLEPFGFLLLLALFYTGLIPMVMRPIMSFAHELILG